MQSATNRELQRAALEELASKFPEKMDGQRMFPSEPRENVAAVLAYLEQHGLVEVKWARPLSGPAVPVLAAITAQGIDFIADDGGISAILGVVTVKLHDDTIRDLLISRIENSDEDGGVKARMIEQIKNLPAEALKNVTMDILKAGLASAPAAYSALQAYLTS